MSFPQPGQENYNNPLETNDYILLESVDDARYGLITLHQHMRTKEIILQKDKVSRDSTDYQRDLYQVKERIRINNPHLIQMIGYSSENVGREGNKKVSGFFEFIDSDLELETESAARDGFEYTSEQLLKLINDISLGLFFLQTRKMVHGNIRPKYITVEDARRKFRVADRLKDPHAPHQVQLNNLKHEQSIYMSPILFENLTTGNRRFRHDPYKSDAFSLGLCVLEAGLCRSVQDIYSDSNRCVDDKILFELVNSFKRKYKDNRLLCELIGSICQFEEEHRPNFSEIRKTFEISSSPQEEIRIVESIPEIKNKEVNRTIASHIPAKVITQTNQGDIRQQLEEYIAQQDGEESSEYQMTDYESRRNLDRILPGQTREFSTDGLRKPKLSVKRDATPVGLSRGPHIPITAPQIQSHEVNHSVQSNNQVQGASRVITYKSPDVQAVAEQKNISQGVEISGMKRSYSASSTGRVVVQRAASYVQQNVQPIEFKMMQGPTEQIRPIQNAVLRGSGNPITMNVIKFDQNAAHHYNNLVPTQNSINPLHSNNSTYVSPGSTNSGPFRENRSNA